MSARTMMHVSWWLAALAVIAVVSLAEDLLRSWLVVLPAAGDVFTTASIIRDGAR